MTDVHSPEVRSKNMRAIRSANTEPEIFVRKALHASGLRYRLGGAGLPGKPDIVLPRYRTVIFINGCFWHGHDCKYFKLPMTRTEFWQSKIQKNRQRDALAIEHLRDSAWNVIVVWECALKTTTDRAKELIAEIIRLLKDFEKKTSSNFAEFSM
jgi:DNA mismatch endonuclease (patch repair protein)